MRNSATTRLAAIFFACLASVPAAAAAPDPLRDRLIADARALAPPTMSFERSTTAQATSQSESESERRVDRWSGKAWTLVSLNGKPPGPDDTAKYAKQAKNGIVPGYYRLANFLAAATGRSTDARGRIVYHVAAMPKGSVNVGSDVSDKMAADISVEAGDGAPYVAQLHVFSREAFRVMLVAKVDSFDAVSEYARGSDGKPVLVRSVNVVTGSQFGKAGTQRTEAVISNVRAARP